MFLSDEYRTTFGNYGCELAQPPPSDENKICKKFHEQIAQLRKERNRRDFGENFVKKFLKDGPTESVLIPTDEIRFGKIFDQPQF